MSLPAHISSQRATLPLPTLRPKLAQDARETLKQSWACRVLSSSVPYALASMPDAIPEAGDVVMVEVESIGHHSRVTTADCSRLRLYRGDQLIGVLGTRYATSAFEGELVSLQELDLLTGAGLIGNVKTRHASTRTPTKLRYLHHLVDAKGRIFNLKKWLAPRHWPESRAKLPPVLLIIGTAMDSGKTTVISKLTKSVLLRDLRVAACKLTGSVSQRDLHELQSTGAHDVRDFSEYGFPSTYLCSQTELRELFDWMTCDAGSANPDLIIMEIADGLLQRETSIVLEDPLLRSRVSGVLLAAPCPSSALYGLARLEALGHRVVALSGLITNSPLFVKELADRSKVTVAASTGNGAQLADVVVNWLKECR